MGNMWREMRFFFRTPFVRYSGILCAVFIVGQIMILAFGIKPKPEPIFLHYTTYLGVDFVGAWYLVYGIPLGSLIVSALNFGLAFVLARTDKVLSYLLPSWTLVLLVLLTIQSVLLTRLNA